MAQTGARFYFEPSKLDVAVGQEFATTIMIDTAGQSVGGAGAILNYDKNSLEFVSIETGSIFDDYPLAAHEEGASRVLVSGIVGSKDDLYKGRDIFAKVMWRAKKEGNTSIVFDFTPGNTKDSNIAIMEAPGDILQSVVNASISIGPGSQTAQSNTNNLATNPPANDTSSPSFFATIGESIKDLFTPQNSEQINPYGPITKADPKTSVQSQFSDSADSQKATERRLAIILLVTLALFSLLVIVIIIILIRRPKPTQI